jgi:NADH:ubiquinone oxidoreductase subunit C
MQHNFLLKTSVLKDALSFLKNHFIYQFKILTCISGLDYPENYYRFSVLYELLSVKYICRLRIKAIVDEITPINSIEKVYMGADWWENEVWDMFGIFFLNKSNITRLLTDYGFQGYPLRKDFPLTGFTESRYSVTKNRVIYENVELAQEYRTFDYISPWEELYNNPSFI